MKLFSVEDANRTLPLVRRIVADIVSSYQRWQERVREFEAAGAGAGAGGRAQRPSDAAVSINREVQFLAAEIAAYVEELTALGIEFKGYETGLVDFPGEIDGRPVYLCWQLGEESVQYWHARDAGFAGRQPLTASMVE
ncbi:MAG TPA: DUF2203 domain-containing protein [Gemmatimonadaceae bacterium]|nr:DUF2203 domain-containing protein [Gemmatimonadaceae bacterium]